MTYYQEIKFKRDTSFRKQFFVPDSFAHPAKMDAQLLIWIVEHYTGPGETILDPMAGSGTAMLACTLGRNVVLVELEEKFCKMMRDNWERVKMKPQLGSTMGNCQIIQGDARQLEGLVDKVITSPPYAETLQGSGADAARKRISEGRYKGLRPDVWTSKGNVAGSTFGDGYSRDPDNIGQLPYGQIDKIVTSPPHGDVMGRQSHEGPSAHGKDIKPSTDAHYGERPDNIGNLKSASYLEAMLQVYQQCYQVLKPEGLMILVTKNFIRNKQVVRLDTDTIKLCEQAGFKFLERYYRKLPSQSFWRITITRSIPTLSR